MFDRNFAGSLVDFPDFALGKAGRGSGGWLGHRLLVARLVRGCQQRECRAQKQRGDQDTNTSHVCLSELIASYLPDDAGETTNIFPISPALKCPGIVQPKLNSPTLVNCHTISAVLPGATYAI